MCRHAIIHFYYTKSLILHLCNKLIIFTSKPTFEPQVKFINKLNELSKKILEFCKIKAQLGASQQEIKVNKIMSTKIIRSTNLL